MAVQSKYIKEMKVTQIWDDSFPAFRLEVPDNSSGIYMGSTVVDAVTSKKMRKVLETAEKKFEDIVDKKANGRQ